MLGRMWIPTLVAGLALAAAGCGSGDDEVTPATTGSGSTTATTGGEQLRVGLITDVGQLDDNGFNELAYKGL